MKSIRKLVVILLGTFCLNQINYAQQVIKLELVHRLNEDSFQLDQTFQSNVNPDMEYDRFEYYLSEITLHFASGRDTVVPEVWVLVNAKEPTNIILGSHDEDSVVSVSLHVGVDSAHNHLDPTLWEPMHPLAPKSFSMHWGWVSGYRFAAIEGYHDESTDFEIHALDDKNYFQTTFTPNVVSKSSSTLQLSVYANYAEAMRDIDVTAGVLTHGADDEAVDLLENFRDHVFTKEEPGPMDEISAIGAFSDNDVLAIWPQPASDEFFLKTDSELNECTLQIIDNQGRLVREHKLSDSNQPIDISDLSKGMYNVLITKSDQNQYYEKLIVN